MHDLSSNRTATISMYLLLPFLLLSNLFTTVHGALLNATIDDHYGDSLTGQVPEYLPTDGGIWEGEECRGCRVQPNPVFAFRNTYNAATYRPEASINPSIRMRFTGNAVYVFLTLANNCGEGITTKTQANITVDTDPPVLFSHEPNMSTRDFDYQYPAFVRTGLEHKEHTLTVFMSGPQEHLFLNFDYAIYTYDDSLLIIGNDSRPATSTTSTDTSSLTQDAQPTTTTTTTTDDDARSKEKGKESKSARIGGGVGGGFFLLLVLVLVCVCIRRRRSRRPGNNVEPEYHHISAFPFSAGAHASASGVGLTTTTPLGSPGSQHELAPSRRHDTHIQPFTELRPTGNVPGSGTLGSGQHRQTRPTPYSQTKSRRGDNPSRAAAAAPNISTSTPQPNPNLWTKLGYPTTNVRVQSAQGNVGQEIPFDPYAAMVSPLQNSPTDGAYGPQQQQPSSMNTIREQPQRSRSHRQGLSEEQINISLETMRRNLDVLTEEMSHLRGGTGRANGVSGTTVVLAHAGNGIVGEFGEDPPEYESPMVTSQLMLPDP